MVRLNKSELMLKTIQEKQGDWSITISDMDGETSAKNRKRVTQEVQAAYDRLISALNSWCFDNTAMLESIKIDFPKKEEIKITSDTWVNGFKAKLVIEKTALPKDGYQESLDAYQKEYAEAESDEELLRLNKLIDKTRSQQHVRNMCDELEEAVLNDWARLCLTEDHTDQLNLFSEISEIKRSL